MRSSVLTATALVLATATLSACGGGVDKQAYVKSVTTLQQKTSSDAAKQSGEMAKATTPAAISEELGALGTSIETNAKALEKIEAPEEVASLHKQYVTLMTDYGNELKELAAEVKSSDAAATNRLLKRASSATSGLATRESKLVTDINSALR